MDRLIAVAGESVVFDHTKLKYHQGIEDQDWIPKIAEEGGWVVISPDKGKHSRVEERLPALCLEYGITHLLLSAKVHDKSAEEKIKAVCDLWVQIEALADLANGSRYHMKIRSIGNGADYTFYIHPDAKFGNGKSGSATQS